MHSILTAYGVQHIKLNTDRSKLMCEQLHAVIYIPYIQDAS